MSVRSRVRMFFLPSLIDPPLSRASPGECSFTKTLADRLLRPFWGRVRPVDCMYLVYIVQIFGQALIPPEKLQPGVVLRAG